MPAESFREDIGGLSEGSRHLDTLIVSGNVSPYRATKRLAILPAATIRPVGIVEDAGLDVSLCPRSDAEGGPLYELSTASEGAELVRSRFMRQASLPSER